MRWIALLFCTASATLARDDYVISQRVDLVPLQVSVRDSRGGYVSDLSRSDFSIYEDRHPRPLKQFSKADAPVTVGLVVDDSGSMVPKRPEVVMSGLAFAKASNPHDEFFVVNFNNSVLFGLPRGTAFTDDLSKLRSALYYGTPMGQTALYDAVSTGLKHLKKGNHEQQTLIVVSDGGDNASHVTERQIMAEIEASRATVYAVALTDPQDSDTNFHVLKRMTVISGGEFVQPKTLDEVLPAMQKIAEDIRHRYSIAFAPDETGDRHVHRTVKVVAKQAGRKLVVRSRTSFALPPAVE